MQLKIIISAYFSLFQIPKIDDLLTILHIVEMNKIKQNDNVNVN